MAVTLEQICTRIYNNDWPGHGRIAAYVGDDLARWKLSTGPGTDRRLTAAEAVELTALLETRRAEAEALLATETSNSRRGDLLLMGSRLLQSLDILADAVAAISAKLTAAGQPLGATLNNRIAALRTAIDNVKAG